MATDLIELISQVRAGKVEAYRHIVRRFQGMALGYALALVRDHHAAEDAAQEAFLEAYRNLDRLAAPAAFPGWFRQIVRRRCSRLTRGKRVATVSLDAARDVQSTGSSPEHVAQQHEIEILVRDAIESLPEQQRTVTVMFYVGRHSHKDICAFLDLPVGTVKHQFYLARKALDERMVYMVKDTLAAYRPTQQFEQRVLTKMVQAGIALSQGLGGFPVLETQAVRLRELRPADDARACMEGVPYGARSDWKKKELQDALKGVRDRFYDKHYVVCWAIARKHDDRMIGNVRYWEWQGHPECGLAFGTIQFDIAPGHEALAAQAVRAAGEFGLKTLGLARVQWSASAGDAIQSAKAKVMEAGGFVREGLLRAWWYNSDQKRWVDEMMYSLVAADLQQEKRITPREARERRM